MNQIDTRFVGSESDNDIVLDAEGVSRRHLEITLNANQCMVIDHKSTNGTFYRDHGGNWTRLTSKNLSLDDELKIANHSISIRSLLQV